VTPTSRQHCNRLSYCYGVLNTSQQTPNAFSTVGYIRVTNTQTDRQITLLVISVTICRIYAMHAIGLKIKDGRFWDTVCICLFRLIYMLSVYIRIEAVIRVILTGQYMFSFKGYCCGASI